MSPGSSSRPQEASSSPAKASSTAPTIPDGADGLNSSEGDEHQFEEPVFPHNGGSRLLELQLMHRWSAWTYKSMCTPVTHDDVVWQNKVPMWSLKYDFLLDGLLALTAFDAANSCSQLSESRVLYITTAVEYQARAIGKFRHQLECNVPNTSPDADHYEPVLVFSTMLMALALASPQFTADIPAANSINGNNIGHSHDALTTPATDMVQNTITHYELIRGCDVLLGEQGAQYMASNPYFSRLTRFEDLPRTTAATDVAPLYATIIAKLQELNERRLTASTVSDAYDARVRHVANFEACKRAIAQLEESFAKCGGSGVEISYQGYVLGYLNFAGEQYVSTIKENDRVALLVLMCWGAFVEMLCSSSSLVWWARRFGSLLVDDISARMGDDDQLTSEVVLAAKQLIQQSSG